MILQPRASAAPNAGVTRGHGSAPGAAVCVYSARVYRTDAYLGPDDAPLYFAEILAPRLYEGGQRQAPLRGPGRTAEAALRFLHARIVQHTGGVAQRDTVSYAYDRDSPPALPVRTRTQRALPRRGIVLKRDRRL